MPFESPRVRRAVTASLGVLLLAATVFAPLGTIAWSHQYTVEQVEPDDPQLGETLAWVDQATSCYPENDACELFYSLKDTESRVVTDSTYHAAQGDDQKTRLVIFPDSTQEFYRLQLNPYENESIRIGLTPISNATALEQASTPSGYYPRGVQNLVEEGQIRTNEQLSGYALWSHTRDIIAHDNAYYRQDSFTYRGSVFGGTDFHRLVLLAVGAVLCYRAGRIK
ncbi:hypothetical protein [Natronoarchaeum rubrum]|uniref:hypothetical protein n=1 Tax=Natronoarchaeum rubrum TaxID=755311 RepID=UPI002111F04B|nr:hypothetical protein [Natronoarchaeum rubrum]